MRKELRYTDEKVNDYVDSDIYMQGRRQGVCLGGAKLHKFMPALKKSLSGGGGGGGDSDTFFFPTSKIFPHTFRMGTIMAMTDWDDKQKKRKKEKKRKP